MNPASDLTTPTAPALRTRILIRLAQMRRAIARLVLLPTFDAEHAHDLRVQVAKEGELTRGYMLMCALSAGIATLGLLQSSTAVVIGAMLISPLMGPIAALGFGFASVDGKRIRAAARVVAVGALIGVVTGILLTWLSPIRNATPEIIARTEPTLLDLAIALLSGVAGGYATVLQKGGTSIGVAIATALMPPLATLGYGIGVAQPAFIAGALLLFMTNLAAIAFAFAVVARLSGVARPLAKVEWTTRHTLIALLSFLALALPLGVTLLRMTQEAQMRSEARTAILAIAGAETGHIAQLDASWPVFGKPTVDAVVITPTYVADADQSVQRWVTRAMRHDVTVSLQQVLAADLPSQTRALVNAAMERTAAGITRDVPPFAAIRAAVGLPTRGLWVNRAERLIQLDPVAAPGWTLADYRAAETLASEAADGWTVCITPPPTGVLRVSRDGSVAGTVSISDAVWAVQRWGLNSVALAAPPASEAAGDFTTALRNALVEARIAIRTPPEGATVTDATASLFPYAPPPSDRVVPADVPSAPAPAA